MRGHEKIIEARMAKQAPKFVFLNDWPCKTDWFEHGDHATVSTFGDPLSSLDLRFLTGLSVSISALVEFRAKAIFQKAIDAGAIVVAGCHVTPDARISAQNGWAQIYKKEIPNG